MAENLTGGKVNYYLAQVDHPQREDQPAYQAECEDIIQALKMDFNQACEFKAIWRTAAAALGNGKPGHKALYDAEKRVHYATRSLKELQRAQTLSEPRMESDVTRYSKEIGFIPPMRTPNEWVEYTGEKVPEGLEPDDVIQLRLLDDFVTPPVKVVDVVWSQKLYRVEDKIVAYMIKDIDNFNVDEWTVNGGRDPSWIGYETEVRVRLSNNHEAVAPRKVKNWIWSTPFTSSHITHFQKAD